MASSTLNVAVGKSTVNSPRLGVSRRLSGVRRRLNYYPPGLSVRAEATSAPMVPDMDKRNLMNLALLGAASLPIGSLVFGYASFIVPPR